MSTIAVVDVITQYLMTVGPLLGDIKKRGFYPSMLDRLSIVFNIAVQVVSVSFKTLQSIRFGYHLVSPQS